METGDMYDCYKELEISIYNLVCTMIVQKLNNLSDEGIRDMCRNPGSIPEIVGQRLYEMMIKYGKSDEKEALSITSNL